MIGTNTGTLEAVERRLDRGDGFRVAGAALFEAADCGPAEHRLAGDLPPREIARGESVADNGDCAGDGTGLIHAHEHTAHEFEQSSAQKTGRASLRLVPQNALMKMSTAEIMEKLEAHTGWSWRAPHRVELR